MVITRTIDSRFAVVFYLILVAGCGVTPKHTERLNHSIGYEVGAETLARHIDDALPGVIVRVEKLQKHRFRSTPNIFVFASDQSFEDKTRYHANRVAGLSLPGGLYLAPQPKQKVMPIVTHELSHLLLRQWVGAYQFYRIPIWFREGLATWIADGGGAETVSRQTAEKAIAQNETFIPNPVEGLIVRKDARYWNLGHHMFYRQASLFVEFLVRFRGDHGRSFLHDVHRGMRLSKALQATYNRDVNELWALFVTKSSSLSSDAN